MIAAKVMTLKVRHVHARRISCPHCRKPFTYLAEENLTLESYGVPLLSSDESMRASVAASAKKRLAKEVAKRNWGSGLCPHCRRYAPWMVWKSRRRSMGRWCLYGGFGVLMATGLLAALSAGAKGGGDWVRYLGFTALLSLPVIGWLRALPAERVPGKGTPLSLKDEELHSLLVHAGETGENPLAVWWLTVFEAPPKNRAFVTTGFRDMAGGGPIPEDLEAEAVLERL